MGTRVPKGYLIVDKASFGTSGQALLQQHKPFGRSVFTLQSSFLKELVNVIKLDLAIAGKFDREDTEFELLMNFPVVEDSSDRIGIKNDTIGLAKEVISTLQDVLGVNEGLPPDVVKDILTRLSFLSQEDINTWVDTILKNEMEMSEKGHRMVTDRKYLTESAVKKLNRYYENGDSLVREAYFQSKNNVAFFEGIQNKKHFVSSGISKDRNYNMLFKLVKEWDSPSTVGNKKRIK
jgi:hypothetical protein